LSVAFASAPRLRRRRPVLTLPRRAAKWRGVWRSCRAIRRGG
jgi:hypothetical protein